MKLKPKIKELFKSSQLDFSHEGFENIRDLFFNSNTSEFRGYGNLMEYIENTYGEFARVLMYFAMLNDYLHANENGGYENFFSNGYLTLTDDYCSESELKLDLLIREGKILAKFVGIYAGPYKEKELIEHFNNVKIKLDTRELITYDDIEHKEILKIYEKAQNNSVYSKYLPRNIEVLVFENPHEYAPANLEEIYEYTNELIRLFSALSLEDRIQDYFEAEYNNLKDPLPVIDLHMCYKHDDPFKRKQLVFNNPLVFEDNFDSPEAEAFRLIQMIKDYQGHDVIQINTSSKNIFNILRYLTKMNAITFLDDYFTFKPYNQEIIKINTSDGLKNKNIDKKFIYFMTSNIIDITSASLEEIINFG